ncbi:hypothetical protein GOB94_13995 [Granulicella sp. 5B5]|uniref:hypothetical protein n=1 Tax=Granulicella sp. 5B5 TaxID=1617967 RepID=UPI0015F3AB67|nr:hypothetical protein [Granulicella sp. 5B5]QMV19677.1 hypothetical protein GOB94_13995 [Granulicella sp. 5B5]
MNAAAWAALFAGMGFLLTLFGVIFLGGKLSQRVDEHGGRLDDHDVTLGSHGIRLSAVEKDAAYLKGWHEGRSDARHEQ